jgi:putative membrane protein
MFDAGYIPYCGSPPVPGGAVWNLDPILWTALLLGGLAYAVGFRRQAGADITRTHALYFAVGWAILSLALVSPLCNLSVALFSARVGQHMIIALIAAPLIVVGGADRLLQRALFKRDSEPGRSELAMATLAFAAAVWFWHMPGPYDATFRSDVVYWTMHVTMFVAAFAVWRVILRSAPGPMLLASVATGIQMFGIGAIIALSPIDLFPAHAATTWPWGLTPLQDQSLGGLIMWVPGGLILTLEVVVALGRYIHQLDQADGVGDRRAQTYSSVSK